MEVMKSEQIDIGAVMGPFSLRAILDGITQAEGGSALEKGIILDLHASADIPASLIGNGDCLQAILSDFVKNAVGVAQSSEVALKAKLVEKSHNAVVIEFVLTCHGDESDLKSYVDLGNASHDRGLGTACALVTKMNSSIQFEQLTKSEFVYKFQLGFKIEAQPQSDAAALSVLVAEDSPVSQMVARRILEKMGCAVRTASNGQEAVDAFSEAKFDVILMDVQMPGKDGLQAAKEIRLLEEERQLGRVLIVALTSHAETDAKDMCIDSGMDDYLAKPLDVYVLEELVSCLRELKHMEKLAA